MAARSLTEVRDAALFPNYYGQTCYHHHHHHHHHHHYRTALKLLDLDMMSRQNAAEEFYEVN